MSQNQSCLGSSHKKKMNQNRKNYRIGINSIPAASFHISSLNNEELQAVVKKSVAEEMCMTVEDFLSRRTRQNRISRIEDGRLST